jgi:hypothetical protein
MSILLPPSHVGRKPRPIQYVHVSYDEHEYTVGILQSADIFVIDRDDYDKIQPFSWHKTANTYISCGSYVDGVKRTLYLHNLIMDKLTFTGKGQQETVDHVNRNGLDNRKENLRILSQTDQNLNQKRKPRSVELPTGCGVSPDEIPKHIWYVRANGLHGDRFAIEFKTEDILWRTTSSKAVILKDKLMIAKEKLAELYTLYPYLNPDNPEILGEIQSLNESFIAIVSLAALEPASV